MYLMICVDDTIIASCVNLEYVLEMKTKFCSQFDMTDMGSLEHFLNVRVNIFNWIRACILRKCWRSMRRSSVLPTKSGSLHYSVMEWIGLHERRRSWLTRIKFISGGVVRIATSNEEPTPFFLDSKSAEDSGCLFSGNFWDNSSHPRANRRSDYRYFYEGANWSDLRET